MMFLEFPGLLGEAVFVSADAIAQVSVGGPQNNGHGDFYHEIRVAYKPGVDGLIEKFYVDYDELGVWLCGARKVLNNEAFFSEGVPEEGFLREGAS